MTVEQARELAKKQLIEKFVRGRLVLCRAGKSQSKFYAKAPHWQRGFLVEFETLVALRAEDVLQGR
jgi:CDGSH-type Zn-finger protein